MTTSTTRIWSTAANRRAIIMQRLNETQFASVTDLVDTLGVSDMTIRRDLKKLAENQLVNVVHGGASLVPAGHHQKDFSDRAVWLTEIKRAIADRAQEFISDKTVVALDAGTTSAFVGSAMDPSFQGTIISHSVPVFQIFLDNRNVRMLGLGGELSHESQAFIGPRVVADLNRYRADTLFLGAAAINEDGLYTNADIELPVKLALIESSTQVVLVADHTKFGTSSAVFLAGFDAIDRVITDRDPGPDICKAMANAGTELIVAE